MSKDIIKNIEELIIENEANKKANALRDNSSTLLTYWNIGKLIVEAQGGEKRAKYGDNLISEWGKKLSEKYGKNYGVRTLQRNISSQYYYRLLKSQVKEPVIKEMEENNKENYLINKLEFVKNPVIAEFLGYSLDSTFTETELETSIINNLQKFLMELR